MEFEKTRFRQLVFLALGALLLIVYAYRLTEPVEPYFDEVHYVRFIRALLFQHQYWATSNVHPPLWHVLTALVVRLLGDYSLSWRLVSLTCGMLLFIPLYWITKRLTASRTTALLAVFFMAFDCLSLTQARSAMMNSQMLLFILVSVYAFIKAFPAEGVLRRKDFILSGVFLGLALATKLVALNIYLFFIPLLIAEYRKRKKERMALIRDTVVFMLVLPACFFVAVHLFIPFLEDRTLADIWGIWKFHMHYNLTTQQTHTYSSRWWSWPLMLRPIWFYFKTANWTTPAASTSGIIAIGNPAIFWMIPVMVVNLADQYFFRKSRAAGWALWGFLSQWMSFGLVQRLQFFHYFYSAMPFVVIGFAMMVRRVWGWGRAWRAVVVVYLILVAAMFVYWYPLLAGIPVSGRFYGNHIWFKAWI